MNMAFFFAGIAAATFAGSAVFFLKFWLASRDRFYLYFSSACFLLTVERVTIVTLHELMRKPVVGNSEGSESGIWVYLIRLAAFALILAAVLLKNRNRESVRN